MPPLNRHQLPLLFVISLPFVCGGATCHLWSQPQVPAAPTRFATPPSLDEALGAVNENTRRVSQLQTDSALLTIAGVPAKLRASIAMEQPQRFRLQARVFSPELDLGSNDELFWFWAKSNPDRALYFARHTDYVQSGASRLLPVEPQWLIEAFGLIRLDQDMFYEGPFSRDDGTFEIRSTSPGVAGRVARSLVIDGKYGWIVEQTVTDEMGQVLAHVKASEHRFDPVSGASLPHQIAIELPQTNLALQINVSDYSINQLYGDPAELWSLPPMDGYELVNVAGLERVESPAYSPYRPAPGSGPLPQTEIRSGFRPNYRGYTTVR